MPISITIRDVPSEVRNELAARAAKGGRSLQEYLRAELIRMADKPDIETWIEQVRERKRAYPVDVSVDEIVSSIRDLRGE